jgi:peroxiredoxin
MKKFILASLLVVFAQTLFALRVGDAAPSFTATDSHGQQHKLADYTGKIVVLEWHNQGCPYTKKHYDSGNMQKLQKEWTGKGVIWLTVIPSAPGQQG